MIHVGAMLSRWTGTRAREDSRALDRSPSRNPGTRHAFSGLMAEPRTLRCYKYVNRPYEIFRELLHRDPLKLLQRATTSAAARASTLITNLRVQLAGIDIGVDVRVSVRRIRDQEAGASGAPVTRVELGWEATR